MGTCNPDELEAVMSVIDNPIKRKIIQKLSEEPAYALQLAKELGLGQQNVNKHLKKMEAEGIIESIEVESPAGPKRKIYTIKKFYSLRINFASNLYSESLKCFDDPNEWSEDEKALEEFESRLEKISDSRPKSEKLDELNLFISDIEDEVNSIERKLSKLLYLRNLAMREALISMSDLTRRERRVMYRILDQKSTTCEIISEQLDMRETIVDEVIKRLKEKGIKSIEGKN